MSQYRHPKPNFRLTMEITKTPRALSQTRPSLLPDSSLKNRAKPFKDGRFLISDRSLKREREFRSSARFSWFSNAQSKISLKLGKRYWKTSWAATSGASVVGIGFCTNKNLNPCRKKEKCFNFNLALFEKKCFCQRKREINHKCSDS